MKTGIAGERSRVYTGGRVKKKGRECRPAGVVPPVRWPVLKSRLSVMEVSTKCGAGVCQ